MINSIEDNPHKPLKKRRIFYSDGVNTHQILSLNQGSKGDLTFSFPNFEKSEFHAMPITGLSGMQSEPSPGVGKLTIHKDGFASIRANNDLESRILPIRGNHLLDLDKEIGGIRHLFTAYLSKPNNQEKTLFGQRSDYLISATDQRPFALIALAIPLVKGSINIDFNMSIGIDKIDGIPLMGIVVCDLRYHLILLAAYRTKFMDKWPDKNQLSYGDGYICPMFVGKSDSISIDWVRPKYSYDGNVLKIILNHDSKMNEPL